MSRLLTALWCSTLLVACPSTGSAGSNAGGSVELSWDASALRSSPSASGQRVFPLYLSLKDIPDLSQLVSFQNDGTPPGAVLQNHSPPLS